MPTEPALVTERLFLRAWRDEDLVPFASLTADPQGMEHFPSVLSRQESDALAERVRAHFDAHGFGPWVLESRETGEFIGCTGLLQVNFDAHFSSRERPAIEVAWRIARRFWGLGYAPEAARAAIDAGFEALDVPEIVAFTVPANVRSIRVMQKLGMVRDPADDFDHPRIPEGHRLRRHVLHRLSRDRWLETRGLAGCSADR